MSIELEQDNFGRLYIEYVGPAGHTKFTYLLKDQKGISEQRLNGLFLKSLVTKLL